MELEANIFGVFISPWYLSLVKIQKNLWGKESQKSLSWRLCLKLLYSASFFSAFQYLQCYYNEYPVKQTASWFLKLPLEPAFYEESFCYFWKSKWENSSMEGDKVGIFSKVPDWKPLFLLKLNKTEAPQTKTTSRKFIRISGPIPNVENLHWSMIMKILLHIQNSPSKAMVLANKRCLF